MFCLCKQTLIFISGLYSSIQRMVLLSLHVYTWFGGFQCHCVPHILCQVLETDFLSPGGKRGQMGTLEGTGEDLIVFGGEMTVLNLN